MIEDPKQCYCDCHDPNSNTMHFVECCAGKCEFCSKTYRYHHDLYEHNCYGKEQSIKNPKGRWKLK